MARTREILARKGDTLWEAERTAPLIFPPEDWYLGFFVDSTMCGMFRMTMLEHTDVASFVKSYESRFKNEPAKSHFIMRASEVVGKYTEEGVIERVKDFPDKEEALEQWRNKEHGHIGKNIISDYIIFHVPSPSTRENAHSLAEQVLAIREKIDFKQIRRGSYVKEKYLIPGID